MATPENSKCSNCRPDVTVTAEVPLQSPPPEQEEFYEDPDYVDIDGTRGIRMSKKKKIMDYLEFYDCVKLQSVLAHETHKWLMSMANKGIKELRSKNGLCKILHQTELNYPVNCPRHPNQCLTIGVCRCITGVCHQSQLEACSDCHCPDDQLDDQPCLCTNCTARHYAKVYVTKRQCRKLRKNPFCKEHPTEALHLENKCEVQIKCSECELLIDSE